MATIRKQAIAALVTILQNVTPAGGYVNDLSAAGTVTKGVESFEMRRDIGRPIIVRVYDGAEAVDRGSLTTARRMNAHLALVVEVLVRAVGDTPIVDTVQDIVGDIRLAIDKAPRLIGTVADAFVGVIQAPTYDFTQKVASVVLMVQTEYDYLESQSV